MKNIYIPLVLMLVVVSCVRKEDNEATLIAGPKYSISGTVYKEDGKTVAPNHSLQFVAITDEPYPNNKVEIIGKIDTDKEGKFSFEYSQIPDNPNTTITLLPPTITPNIFGPILDDIPINHNFSRDLCVISIKYKQFKFVFDKKHNGDTVYIASKTPINTGYNLQSIYYLASFYPLKNSNSPLLDSISTSYAEPNLQPIDFEVFYTTNKENFIKATSSNEKPADFSSLVKTAKFKLEIFPVVNSIELDLD